MKIILATILILFAGGAGAVERVAEFVSMNSVQDRDAWVASIAGFASKWTAEHHVELCGAVATDDVGRLGIVLTTSRSPAECHFSHAIVPEGFVSTGETFHTHPRTLPGGRVQMSLAQRRKFGNFRVSEKDFSPQDYSNGPGYVLTGDMLLHQAGAGTRRVVSSW